MPNDDGQLMKTAKRRRQVIQLREGGATWRRIAEIMERRHGLEKLPSGWDERYAYTDWKREFEKIKDDIKESTEAVRNMEVRRIDRMLRSIWPKALGKEEDGDVSWEEQRQAIDRVIKLQKRREKLQGLAKPKKYEHAGPGRGPIEYQEKPIILPEKDREEDLHANGAATPTNSEDE